MSDVSIPSDRIIIFDDATNTDIILENAHSLAPSEQIRRLRAMTGMNRKEFCEYLEIPYRTVTEWEKGGRVMPEYVLRLIEYKLRGEKMLKELTDEDSEK